MHRIDFIEKAGTGIKRIRDDSRAQGCPEPKFQTTGFFTTIFYPNPKVRTQAEAHVEVHEAHVEAHGPMTGVERTILLACSTDVRSTPDLLGVVGHATRTGGFKKALGHLVSDGLLEMTVPDKPRSSKQRYRITARGAAALERSGKKE